MSGWMFPRPPSSLPPPGEHRRNVPSVYNNLPSNVARKYDKFITTTATQSLQQRHDTKYDKQASA